MKLSVSVSASFFKFDRGLIPRNSEGGFTWKPRKLMGYVGQQGEVVWPGTCRTSAARSCAARRRAAKVACKRVQLRRASSWYLGKLIKNLWKVDPKTSGKLKQNKHRNQTLSVCVFFGISNCQLVFCEQSGIYSGNLYGLIHDLCGWLLDVSLHLYPLDLLHGTPSGWFHSCLFLVTGA